MGMGLSWGGFFLDGFVWSWLVVGCICLELICLGLGLSGVGLSWGVIVVGWVFLELVWRGLGVSGVGLSWGGVFWS